MPHRRQLLAAGAALALPGGRAARAEPQAAPDFAGIAAWLNTPAPLTLAGLRGKVVLVDFWTYSCINCRRTVPYLNRWQAEYGPHGLQVVGIHTPEFGFERMRANVEDAVREFGIRYPVGQDNEFGTWRAWDNRAWPAFYLLDRDGRVVLLREGEGHAREMETAMRGLLGLPAATAAHPGDDPDLSQVASPEIYFGSGHATPQARAQARAQSPRPGEATYGFGTAPGPALDQYELDGTWLREEEHLALRSPRGRLRLRFSAARLHLVATAPTPATLRVSVDGTPARPVQIGRPSLYTLLDGDAYGSHLVEFEADTPGLTLYSATFG